MDEDQLHQLISEYLNGTATAQEREQVLAWYREHNEQTVEWPAEQVDERQEIKNRVFAHLQQHIQQEQEGSYHLGRWLAAASILLICTFTYLYKTKIYYWLIPVKQQYAVTQYGEHKIITLPDSSKVLLAGGSRLQYPNHFRGNTREISFSGEAFFNVTKDKKHPFIIHTGTVSTKVLGTTFDLTAYKEQQAITVTLLTGKVAFSDSRNTVTILPNQRAVYVKQTGRIAKEDYPDAQKMLARSNGNYEYDSVPVSEVINDLRHNYNLNIVVNGDAGNCQFYGRLKAGESSDTFLKKMCMIMNATLDKKGNTYIISGGGCMDK